ncbi:ABC transporter substrate-binding protein [Bradyrhizobium genosp. L]|uniref:ABC transporter substrate-binding protein n=1 Tax=Bradyrhizobium genosp. L TaxID=83637 RepID=UPI0018A2E734|nr:ABC transporter substrate-binding protein [Bradyrhizobium genosp. L]QPF82575.1 ABC transporter substrate-binding protein [Bradyrhizobium genosp. L]
MPHVSRRTLLKLAAAAPPAITMPATFSSRAAAASKGKTITAVMHSDLRIIDPGITTAYITRDHGYMVYDTLLGIDAAFKVHPQMADWTVSDDKLTYTFTLRDGLKWHDGAPVTAGDCVASLKRWSAIDGMAQKLAEFTATLEASGPKTIVLKLKEPYGLVLESIAKPSSYVAFMMPKRMAETPPGKQITEQIGSGPFKFATSEFQPGVKAVYEKNADYLPRKEKPEWTSGGKVAKVDRVEWITMPDAQTAINALQSGDIDFMELPPIDLLPPLEANSDLTVAVLNKFGFQIEGRMNFLLPPFDNPKVRRAAFLALNQKDVLDATVGNPKYYEICGAAFACNSPLASDVGAETLIKGNGLDAAKKALAESGYDGTPVVIMIPADNAVLKSPPIVVAQRLREAGFTVDAQTTDWQTLVSRRSLMKPTKEGGWNMFFTFTGATEVMNPIANNQVVANGKRAWFGWPEDEKLEALRDAFARSTSPDEQKKLAIEIQKEAYEQVIFIPLGQFRSPSAWRKSLTGVLEGPAPPVFWNVDKSE